MKKDLSIVIPCYCSTQNIHSVINDIDTALADMAITYEIILVNDHSPDNTFDVLKELAESRSDIIAIDLARNCGQHGAIMAGFHYASGDFVATCEDDGQTQIEILPEMLRKLKSENLDVVSPRFTHRAQPSFTRRIFSGIAGLMRKWMLPAPDGIQVTIFFVARRFVIEEMLKYEQPYPYVTGLILRTTHNIGTMDAVQKARLNGTSGYSFKKLFSLWMNGFTAFSIKPLRLATFLGALSACIGFIAGLVIIIRKGLGHDFLTGWSSTIAILLFMFGIVLIVLGLIGEYLGRIYLCINQTPQYVIRDVINNSSAKDK